MPSDQTGSSVGLAMVSNSNSMAPALRRLAPFLLGRVRRGIVGSSRYAQKLRDQIRRAAADPQATAVLISGEPGLEKDNVATLIHYGSPARKQLLVRLNGALLRESRTDGLTRIANRRAWDESLNLEESRRQRHGHQIGLVVVDLDGFKQINDEQGHQMGDQVLKIAASQLGDQMRSTDLLARVGGDEFALMVFNPSAAGLDELVDRLREALQACGVQASIGAAMSEPRTTLEQTWAKADEAMYTYKPQTSKKLNPRRAIDQSGHRA